MNKTLKLVFFLQICYNILMKKAVYPGSFDPMTCGHLDILRRSLNIFDEVIVLPASNSTKQSLFTTQQRIDQIQRIIETEHISDRVSVDTFDGLLVDYCTKKGIFTIIRGLRPFSDFEYEFELASANRGIDSRIETVFLITNLQYSYLRSSILKDLARLDGDITGKIPECIKDEFIARVKRG